MAVLRRYFCNPTETFNTLCTVPVYNTIEQENHWCEINYNSTKCVEIRDAAQEKVVNFLFIFYDTNAAWGIGQLVLVRT